MAGRARRAVCAGPLFVCRRGGRRRRAQGDAARGRRGRRGGGRARAVGGRRRRAAAAPGPDAARVACRASPPGDDIAGLPDDEATAIAVEVGRRLWRPAAAPFRWIGDWVPRWLDNAEGHPLVPLARELYGSLDVGRDVLVHGDFHHHNILHSARGPLAIDAKAMLGEPEYDVPSFLWNPIPYRMDPGVTARRLAAFAAAGLDQERMRKWTVIRGAYLRCGRGRDRGATRARLGTAAAAPRGAPSSSSGRGGAGRRGRS